MFSTLGTLRTYEASGLTLWRSLQLATRLTHVLENCGVEVVQLGRLKFWGQKITRFGTVDTQFELFGLKITKFELLNHPAFLDIFGSFLPTTMLRSCLSQIIFFALQPRPVMSDSLAALQLISNYLKAAGAWARCYRCHRPLLVRLMPALKP